MVIRISGTRTTQCVAYSRISWWTDFYFKYSYLDKADICRRFGGVYKDHEPIPLSIVTPMYREVVMVNPYSGVGPSKCLYVVMQPTDYNAHPHDYNISKHFRAQVLSLVRINKDVETVFYSRLGSGYLQ